MHSLRFELRKEKKIKHISVTKKHIIQLLWFIIPNKNYSNLIFFLFLPFYFPCGQNWEKVIWIIFIFFCRRYVMLKYDFFFYVKLEFFFISQLIINVWSAKNSWKNKWNLDLKIKFWVIVYINIYKNI